MEKQKTIFISAFEGVETKNILRTGILKSLLNRPDLKIVLLMKNVERANLYKKEFAHPRIFFEVAPYSRNMGRGLDRFFAFLKFRLIRSETTKLRRKLAFEANRDFISYYAGALFSFLFARPIFRKFLRYSDFKLVRHDQYVTLFDKYNPDLVFLAHLFEEPEIHILREAKKRKIKSIGFINSWDKVTARCAIRILPDKIVVFNDIIKEEMICHDDVGVDSIFVGGLPQYDTYFNDEFTKREDFFKRIRCDSSCRLIVYAPMGSAFSSSDWDIIDLLHRLNKEKKFGEETEILVRFQPNDFLDEEELKKRPYLKYDYPGKRFSKNRGVDWDMNFEDLRNLKDTLYHMDLLICYASSLSIDAAIFDKPIININFDIKKPHQILKSPTWFYTTEHYKKALDTGGIKLVNSEGELIKWVNLYLENPNFDQRWRRKLVEEQCKFTNGRSGERIGKFILENLGYLS